VEVFEHGVGAVDLVAGGGEVGADGAVVGAAGDGVLEEPGRSYALMVYEVTGLPLVGMTMAGDGSWSCRRWDTAGIAEHGESVRVTGTCFRVTWNDLLARPLP
jgi:hypothetical protein